MEKTTAIENKAQGIQKTLEEYMGNKKAAKVAIEIFTAMYEKIQHIHKDEDDILVHTKESVVRNQIKAILDSYLEEGEVQECINQLIDEQHFIGTKTTTQFETIKIQSSDDKSYAKLLKHNPVNKREVIFMDRLKRTIITPIKDFRVYVCDPSINDEGKLQFVPGFQPAVGYSYNEWEKLAKENGLRLGSNSEYIMFLGTLINRLTTEGWSEADAWYAVCTNSKNIGHYCDSEDAKHEFEPTGSRKIVGKCDLANAYKILARDEEANGCWLASGLCNNFGSNNPLADLSIDYCYDYHFNYGVGWLVC